MLSIINDSPMIFSIKLPDESPNNISPIFYESINRIQHSELFEYKKLKEIAHLRRGPFGGSIKKEIFVKDEINTYEVYEQYNAINKDPYNGRYFILSKDYERLKSFQVKKNDILMSCSGTIGEMVLIPKGARDGVINQALLRIRVRKNINIHYFIILFTDVLRFLTCISFFHG